VRKKSDSVNIDLSFLNFCFYAICQGFLLSLAKPILAGILWRVDACCDVPCDTFRCRYSVVSAALFPPDFPSHIRTGNIKSKCVLSDFKGTLSYRYIMFVTKYEPSHHPSNLLNTLYFA